MSTRKRSEDARCSSPEEVVHSFIKAMNEWEREAAEIIAPFSSDSGFSEKRFTAAQARLESSLDEVFRAHCTERARNRPYRRRGSYGIPPEYNPRREKVVRHEIVGQVAFVETFRDTPLGGGRRYTLHRHGGAWRIDSVKRQGRDNRRAEWLAYTL